MMKKIELEDTFILVSIILLLVTVIYFFGVVPADIINCERHGELLKIETKYLIFDGCYTAKDGKLVEVEKIND